TGRAPFCNVRNLPEWSGLKAQRYPGQADIETIDVDINRLDDLLPAGVRIDFIKIDVEGAELDVLRGAQATIRRDKPRILFEHARIHNAEYGTTPEMVYDLLTAGCGLKIYGLDGKGPLEREQFHRIYDASFASNYDRHAETNFLASPA